MCIGQALNQKSKFRIKSDTELLSKKKEAVGLNRQDQYQMKYNIIKSKHDPYQQSHFC